MRLVIFGSRTINSLALLREAVAESGINPADITMIVSGAARGADRLGELYAKEIGVPVKKFYPDWNRLGKKAGFVRNAEMAEFAEKGVGVHDGVSRGSLNMRDELAKRGKFVYLKVVSVPAE